jgi:type IV pilus assembly protein PilM
MKPKRCGPIGLDIGHDYIKMVQLSVDKGTSSVIAAEKMRIDRDLWGDQEKQRDFIISAIKKMFEKGNFQGKAVVTTVPNEVLKITSVRLPEMDDKKTETAVKSEASQRFGLDVKKDSINYVLAGSIRQGEETKNELILFAADDKSIRNHISLIEEAGLRPAAIDTTAYALFRSYDRQFKRQEDKDRSAVFVDVGSQFTTVVFIRGDEVGFIKQISIGDERFNQEIAVKLGIGAAEAETLRRNLRKENETNRVPGENIDAGGPCEDTDEDDLGLDSSTRQVIMDAVDAVAEELAREISLCFRYYTVTFRGKSVERAVIAGGGAYENILLKILQKQLGTEIELAQPFRGFERAGVRFEGDRRSAMSEWTVAVGLGLR